MHRCLLFIYTIFCLPLLFYWRFMFMESSLDHHWYATFTTVLFCMYPVVFIVSEILWRFFRLYHRGRAAKAIDLVPASWAIIVILLISSLHLYTYFPRVF